MCGIAGCVHKNKRVEKDRFENMIDIISYRGPDDRGSFYEDNLALGHRRLSVIDLSTLGRQPFHYMDKYVAVYNGEIYNYKELRSKLLKHGYQFLTETDTEVLIAAYDYYGKECVKYFNGMWSFAIYDRERKELFCSRDRFGIKPFYYYCNNGSFVFGSEIKQILCMIPDQFSVNRRRLMEYLVRGVLDHTSETMISTIMQLRGGYNLVFNVDTGSIKKECYYDLKKIDMPPKSFEESADIFRKEFGKSVALRLRSDVPIGYCLSGGLDSSSIVCMADRIVKSKNVDIKQTSISSCFEDKRYDEQEYIDEVLKYTSVEGKKIFPDGSNLFDELDDMIWHMDEPFGATSEYAEWNVFKFAKKCGLTVMLDGQGADEQLAGYTGFYSVIFAEYLKKFQFKKFVNEFRCYKKLRAASEKYVSTHKILIEAIISAYLPRKIQKLGKLYLFYLRKGLPFEPQDIKAVINGMNLYPANNSKQYILDNIYCNLSMLLHYEDRDSMAHSIESRVPFLDYHLVEAIYSMPIDYKLQNGITKVVMRKGLEDVLPMKIKTRYSKLGFVTPEDQWINGNPELFRKEIIEACNNLAPLLNSARVIEWYDKIAGKVGRMDRIPWRIICAGHWVKIFNLRV